MGAKLFIGTPLMRNKVVIKHLYGLCKMHAFNGSRLYDSREWGLGRPTNSIISKVLPAYPRALNLVSS